ncbi:hypothetical protein [Phycobacter sp. K97]|uniref:hypothetical protein n=1 Tax=Phycobacter sedimenti TaxID=3133977 RepID=UPI00311D5DEC
MGFLVLILLCSPFAGAFAAISLGSRLKDETPLYLTSQLLMALPTLCFFSIVIGLFLTIGPGFPPFFLGIPILLAPFFTGTVCILLLNVLRLGYFRLHASIALVLCLATTYLFIGLLWPDENYD